MRASAKTGKGKQVEYLHRLIHLPEPTSRKPWFAFSLLIQELRKHWHALGIIYVLASMVEYAV